MISCKLSIVTYGFAALTFATAAFGQPSADFAVAKSDAPDPVVAGALLAYTLTVTNNGPGTGAVSLSDTLPANTTFTSMVAPPGWTLTTPAVGSSGTVMATNDMAALGDHGFVITVRVDPTTPNGTIISNTATLSADADPANNSATAMTQVIVPDFAVAKSDAPDPVVAGALLAYTLTVTNHGPGTRAVTLSDTLPANTTFTSMVAPPGWTLTTPAVGSSGTVMSTNDMPALGDHGFVITVRVDPATPNGTIISNTATLSADADPANNSATAMTQVIVPDFAVAKSDAPDPVDAGELLTYTLTVTNHGPGTRAVTLSDTLPANTTFTSMVAPPGWTLITPAVGSSGTVMATNDMPALGDHGFVINVRVDPTTPSGTVIHNTATLSSDANPVNNLARSTTSVGMLPRPAPTLTVEALALALVLLLAIAAWRFRDRLEM